MTDEQFLQDFENSPFGNDSGSLGDVFQDGSGVPWWTPEIDDIVRQIRDELAQKDGTDPATLPSPSPGGSVDPGDPAAPLSSPPSFEAIPPAQTAPGGAAQQTQWPAMCEWAPTVCEWIGWTQEPLDEDLPPTLPVEESGPGEWSVSMSGACPAPVNVSVLGATVPISWQPACDLATLLRPLLIAVAGISAGLILLGQRAGGAA